MRASLRQYARGQICMVRLNGICNHDPQTVVLAHFRLIGISGMGMKSPDVIGAWCCSSCHAAIDSSKDPEVQLSFAHGVLRTIAALVQDDVVKW